MYIRTYIRLIFQSQILSSKKFTPRWRVDVRKYMWHWKNLPVKVAIAKSSSLWYKPPMKGILTLLEYAFTRIKHPQSKHIKKHIKPPIAHWLCDLCVQFDRFLGSDLRSYKMYRPVPSCDPIIKEPFGKNTEGSRKILPLLQPLTPIFVILLLQPLICPKKKSRGSLQPTRAQRNEVRALGPRDQKMPVAQSGYRIWYLPGRKWRYCWWKTSG